MDTNLSSVATASEQAATNVQTVVTAAEQMSATIKGIAANEIKQLASQTADATQETNRKINGIQSTIQDLLK